MHNDNNEPTEGLNAAPGTKNIVYGNQYIAGRDQYIAGRDQYIITIEMPDGRKIERLFVGVPRPPEVFVGRGELITDLKARLIAGSSLAIPALKGLPGVGKTALAAVLANDPDVLDHFSGGVLWAGLGKEPDQMALLGRWRVALGLGDAELASLTSIDERARAIHDRIGQAKMLLVIDDAWDAQAALNFRLGGPNCAHLLTTRIPEVALQFTAKGIVEVAELSTDDGLLLLGELAPKAVEVEPEDARKLVEVVGGLPLAIVLIGGYLRPKSHSGQSRRIKEAIAYLKDEVSRLKESMPQSPIDRHPSLPDTPLSLLATIKLSDDTLKDSEREGIRALAVFAPKPNDFSEAAALWVTQGQFETLDLLTDSGMLEVVGDARYTLHQTIAEYMVASVKGEIEPDAAGLSLDDLRRKHASYYAMLAMHNEGTGWRTVEREWAQIAYGWHHYAGVHDERGDLVLLYVKSIHNYMRKRGLWKDLASWYEQAALAARCADLADIEAQNLGLLVDLYTELGDGEQATKYYEQTLAALQRNTDAFTASSVAQYLARYWELRGQISQARQLYAVSLAGYRNLAGTPPMIRALGSMGQLFVAEGKLDQALDYLNYALKLARSNNDRANEASLLNTLGGVYNEFGEYTKALSYYEQAMQIIQETGALISEATCWDNMGVAYFNLRRMDEAEKSYTQALEMFRKLNNRMGIAKCQANLGALYASTGHPEEAMIIFQDALSVFRQAADVQAEGKVLGNMGNLYMRQGDFEQAIVHQEAALDIARKSSSKPRQVGLLTSIGFALNQQGKLTEALSYYQQALELANQLNEPLVKAVILLYIGDIYQQSAPFLARHPYEEAADIYRKHSTQIDLSLALTKVGMTYELTGESDTALHCYQESLSLCREIEELRGIIINSLGICRVYEAREELREAVPYYLEAAEAYGKQGDQVSRVKEIKTAADNLLQVDELTEAFKLYEDLLPQVRAIAEFETEAYTLNNMAGVLNRRGDLEGSLRYLEASVEAFHKAGNLGGEISVLHNLAAQHMNLGQLRASVDALHKVGLLIRASGDHEEALRYFEGVAQAYRDDLVDGEATVRALSDAANELAALGRETDRSATLVAIAIQLHSIGKDEEAIPYQREAISILKAVREESRAVEEMTKLAELYFAANRTDEALALCKDALDTCHALGNKLGEARSYLLLSSIYIYQGETHKAITSATMAYMLGLTVRSEVYPIV